MAQEKEQCATCWYGREARPKRKTVDCVKHAPIVFPIGQEGETVTAWPKVAPDDCCGDYEPRR
jgi:hypothetical protein